MLQLLHLHIIHPTKGLINIKEQIREYAKKMNIEYTGFTNYDNESLIVFLFPYYTGLKESDANISLYCRSQDYHLIIKKYLEKISDFILTCFKIETTSYVDIDPIDEIDAAIRCNLGVRGRNHLLINEKYGSFVFIGILKTQTYIEPDVYIPGDCLNCNNCIKQCQALKLNDFSLCISAVSQKKGELSDSEKKLLINSNSIFGCDECQNVCPMNKYVKTPIYDFYENRIAKLTKDMFSNLSNKEFKEQFSSRAFAWRGKNVLLRNLTLLEERNNPQE